MLIPGIALETFKLPVSGPSCITLGGRLGHSKTPFWECKFYIELSKWGGVGSGARDWLLFNSPVHTFWIKLTIACLGKEKINNYQVSQALSPLQANLGIIHR